MTDRKAIRRLASVFLAFILLLANFPLGIMAASATGKYYSRIVDANTMDGWQEYFDLDDLTTANAGGVWTDKSVFSDVSAFNGKITMKNPDENFVTALSTIATNKEIVGYSTVPTDTVLVLDVSGSMRGEETALINAANEAIKTLFETNENNRVGVVLYSASSSTGASTYEESVTRLLSIDRYTTGSDGKFLNLRSNGSDRNGTIYEVYVDGDVESATNTSATFTGEKNVIGGTYIQAGLWEAKEMFEEMDTVIGDDNWQSGKNRMPILVLMSDGAPSTGTTYYADVENSYYTTNNNRRVAASNVGNGAESGLLAGNAFLTQLTASYVMNNIEAHYQQTDTDVRGLFYTLGFNIGNNSLATSVMNPDSSTLTDDLWTLYNNPNVTNPSFNVKNRSGSTSEVTISKNSYVTSKSYVDQYFSASGSGLENAFESIVEEIILQSRYYPTHLEGGSPDFSGHVEFTDTLGEYMEIKDIKGILLGDTLFDGHMMASKLLSDGEDGLGTIEQPTALGHEFVRAVKTRLGVSDTATAQQLIASAFAAEQLHYETDNRGNVVKWSNHIDWYAKEDMTFSSFCNEDASSPAALTTPAADEVYKMRSYGFLGETNGSIKNSDMMYMSVQVCTNIETGKQTLYWRIPAALVPLITYNVTLEGTNVDKAKNVQISVEDADSVSPIRLVYESGLRSDLNELNVTRITETAHIADDGVSRIFWNNYFDITGNDHTQHKTTLSEFTPSKENERFYYTFDSAVYNKTGTDTYVLVTEAEGGEDGLDTAKEYYHRRYIFTDDSSTPVFFYEPMSAQSIESAVWRDSFKDLTGKEVGAWVVPMGTPARELQMYSKVKDDEDLTKSAHMVFYPYLTEHNNTYYVDMNLGNNGLLQVTPAQGIKISKTLDMYETGTSDEFSFRLTMHNADGSPYTASLNSYVAEVGTTPTDEPTQISLSAQGTYTFDLKAGNTLWLSGVPAGVVYTVEEISDNPDYKIKSVHVNGVSTGTIVTGTVAAYYIDDVSFVNTPMGDGNLVVTKRVVDENGSAVDIADDITFTAEVALTDDTGAAVYGSFDSSAGTLNVPNTGRFLVRLNEGESFVVRGIPEGTRYIVTETNVPTGFALNNAASVLDGTIDADGNDQALIVNDYAPVGTDGRDITVNVRKQISGSRTEWLSGESYTFVLEETSAPRVSPVATVTIDDTDADKTALFRLSGENYDKAGTYTYRLYEVKENQGGITYDTAERMFQVVVADSDMDGDLEIVSVANLSGTTVTGNYIVSATFENVYRPTGSANVSIDVQKKMDNHSLSGFQFALYSDSALTNEVLRSTITDAQGKANFTLGYAADRASMTGEVYTYYMAEINSGNPNISYSSAVYKVDVTVKDKGDGSISATPQITVVSDGAIENGTPTFTNTYVPSSSDYVVISGTKSISGERILNDGEFSFELAADSSTPDAPLPQTTTVQNLGNAFAFDAIEFGDAHKNRSFVYNVSEVSDNKIGGFTYDGTVYKVYVNVIDNGDATLSAVIERIEKADNSQAVTDIAFVNVYDATDATVTLRASKYLTGKTLQENEFSFRLSAVTENAPMPSSATVKNAADGSITFGEITYDKAGTYVYRLNEVAGSDTRYSYDKSVYTVTVIVTDNSRGVLSADVTLAKDGLPSGEIVFRNSFIPAPFTYDVHTYFETSKLLDGRPLVNGEFEFEFVLINAISGEQIGNSVYNDQNGMFRFPEVTLNTPGVYHFKITEKTGSAKGVSYDISSYHIRLEVEQSPSGVLTVTDQKLYKGTVTKQEVEGVLTEVTTYEDITASGEIVFKNTYVADPVYVTLTATKILEGRNLVDGEFKFDLHKTDSSFDYDTNTLVQDNVTLTLRDDGKGSVVFMPEMFSEVGTYYYVIVEDELDEKGVTSDDTEYKVEVTVTDNHQGNLVATLKVNGSAVTGTLNDTVLFRNTYAAAATEIVIAGKKVLDGRTLQAEEFSFELYDSDGEKIETVKNAADGSFTFSAIPAKTAGEYSYTVREFVGDAANITYDTSVYSVKVTVTDNLDGTFEVSYTYTKGTETADGITFINAYTAPTPPARPTTPESPKTGDNSLSLWLALLFVGGGLFTITLPAKKKTKD